MVNNIALDELFKAASANQAIKDSKEFKDPMKLWDCFWFENEVSCLFADSNLGKSILAVQIADHVASLLPKGDTVLYYDFELSTKQFGLRYTDPKTKEDFKFNDNFIRVTLDGDKIKEICEKTNASFEDVIMRGIENNINSYNSKVIILDNISWLVGMKLTGGAASKLMMILNNLKKKYGLSILVLAHTPKRDVTKPITQNNLSGSKAFTNFFDSMFTIGKSVRDDKLEYIKQIKVRTGSFIYGENNVQLCRITKEGAFLGFTKCGCAKEADLLDKKASINVAQKKDAPKTAVKKATKRKSSPRISRKACARYLSKSMSSMLDDIIAEEESFINKH